MKRLLLLLPILLFSIDENNTAESQYIEENLSQEIKQQEKESFLLEFQYGRMLYNNPRGIACNKCHGKEGLGGQKIAKYYDRQRNPKILRGLDITTYTLKEIKESLKDQYRDETRHRVRHKIMPMYYLTDEEVKAIYTYLQEVKKREEQ